MTRKTKTYIITGAGGVGKTTISAAAAIRLAGPDRRTVVMTVDPARRLADALEVRHHRIAGSQQSRNRLGGVECAAATNTYYNIDFVCSKFSHRLVDHLRRGFPLDLHDLPAESSVQQALLRHPHRGRLRVP